MAVIASLFLLNVLPLLPRTNWWRKTRPRREGPAYVGAHYTVKRSGDFDSTAVT